MEITLLIKSIIGLVILLAILVFILILPSAAKKKKTVVKKATPSKKSKLSTELKDLLNIIKDKSTTTKELRVATDAILKYHGHIHKKLGARAHPEFDTYMDILFTICRHPNTTKNIIINFDKELLRLNPTYKPEINDAITKGLNSRGFSAAFY